MKSATSQFQGMKVNIIWDIGVEWITSESAQVQCTHIIPTNLATDKTDDSESNIAISPVQMTCT
eukprot:m.102643 g.102643  ORF g.102643 m.102643 type:complete len:64 (-) comp13226_c0_seq11:1012-1203(-)